MNEAVSRLQDRVDELKSLLGAGQDDISLLRAVLGLKPQQCEIVGFMLRRSIASRDAIFTVLFGDRPECDQPEIKIIDVQMVRVRKALADELGIELRTEWGSGSWSIPPVGKALIRERMAQVASAALAGCKPETVH